MTAEKKFRATVEALKAENDELKKTLSDPLVKKAVETQEIMRELEQANKEMSEAQKKLESILPKQKSATEILKEYLPPEPANSAKPAPTPKPAEEKKTRQIPTGPASQLV